jgi:hypothetical protein
MTMNARKTSKRLLAVAAGLAIGTALAGPAFASGGGGGTGCFKTAGQLFQGCLADVMEERRIGNATCLNIGDRDERRECSREVAETVSEDREECFAVREARWDACELLGENIYDPDPLTVEALFSPEEVTDGTAPQNPYFDLRAGRTFVLRVVEFEDGEFEDTGDVVVGTVQDADEAVEIQGQLCTTVTEIEFAREEEEDEEEAGEVDFFFTEKTDDYYALTLNSDVIYCGETTIAVEDDEPLAVTSDGSFIAGFEGAKSGYLLRNAPPIGTAERTEWALDEAEDIVEYLSGATEPDEEFGGNNTNQEEYSCEGDACLGTEDTNPLDPEQSELKFYKPGVGFVLALDFEDGEFTGEREELACDFDTLGDFYTQGMAACGFSMEEFEELTEDLCEVAPGAFCDDD